jgi:hypothetical protein
VNLVSSAQHPLSRMRWNGVALNLCAVQQWNNYTLLLYNQTYLVDCEKSSFQEKFSTQQCEAYALNIHLKLIRTLQGTAGWLD